MIDKCRFHILLALIGVLAACLVSGCGSSSMLADNQSGPSFNVPWPADGPATRVASNDTVELMGNEYALLGGDAAENGTDIDMTGGGDLPYAIYTLGGFSDQLEFSQVTLNATATEGSAGDGTQLYVGLANYTANAWEWYTADSGTWTSKALVGANYRSPLGNASVAVVLYGPGTGTINSVVFSRTGDTDLIPPNPISADPIMGRITISWQNVPIADGYNVYRDIHPSLPGPVKLNANPITKLSYADTSMTNGVMYYYFVTAVAGTDESDPSDYVDVFAPETILSAPTNPRVISTTETSALVAWDWGGTPPTQFQLYLEDYKDFNLVSPIQSPTTSGTTTQYSFINLDSGKTYYWRVCAVFGSSRGNMTDDLATSTGTNNDWTWSNMETVGTGTGTVVAIKAGSDLAADYLNGGVVKFSKRSGGTWSEETALDQDTYSTYLDLAYGGGKYIVTGWAVLPGDMWVATGTPGSFTQERIHGDGDTSQGHPSSGMNGHCTITSTDYVVVHTDEETSSTLIQTKPLSGGSWATTSLSNGAVLDTPYNLATDGSNAYLLMKDIGGNQLLFGNKNSGWSMGAAIPSGSPAVFFNSDLVFYNGKWSSPLRDATNKRFILAKGTTVPWDIEQLTSDNVGSNARMDADGTKAGIVYTDAGKWWFVYSEGSGWEFSQISVSGATISGRPDIVFLSGSPYLVFADSSSNKIKAVRGTPPA